MNGVRTTILSPHAGTRRRRRRHALQLCALVLLVVCSALGATATTPTTADAAWWNETGRPNVPGPARVRPPNSQFPLFDGTGYSVFVCNEARLAGFTGDLNKAFSRNQNATNTTPHDGEGGYGGTAVNDQFAMTDTCNTAGWGAGSGLLIRRKPTGTPYLRLDPGGSANADVTLSWTFDVDGGLAIQKFDLDGEQTLYKAGNNDGRSPAVVNPYLMWTVHRNQDPSSVIGSTASTVPANPTSFFSACNTVGRWNVAPPSGIGGYPASQGWRDGDRAYRSDLSAMSDGGASVWMDVSFPFGAIWDTRYYTLPGRASTTPWFGPMQASGLDDAVCNIKGGPQAFYFRPDLRAKTIEFAYRCGITADNPWSGGYEGCRGSSGVNRENPGPRGNMNHQHILMHGARIFVYDNTAPTVSLTAGGLNAGGGFVGSGWNNQIKETLRWNTSDDSGIRRVRVFVNGRLELTQDYTSDCDHRYAAPCPWATGINASQRVAAPSAQPLERFDFDVDGMAYNVLHTIRVEVQDGAGNIRTRDARFRTGTPTVEDDCVFGTRETNRPPAVVVQSRNVPFIGVVPVVVPQYTCRGTTFNDPVQPAPTDAPINTGTLVSDPVPAPTPGIFTYTLARNDRPDAETLDPSRCTVIDRFPTPATGLDWRQRNQVTAVTLDLRAFVKPGVGAELGEQALNVTMSLPSRSTQQYRSAIGCP